MNPRYLFTSAIVRDLTEIEAARWVVQRHRNCAAWASVACQISDRGF